MSEKKYQVLGLMSGSSLDGLDIAFCEFHIDNQPSSLAGNEITSWKILQADTIPFSEMWQSRLAHLPQQNALTYAKTHVYLGHYMGELVNQFLTKYKIEPDFIASHGHTIFHYPDKRMTAQIGDGAALAAVTGYPVIADFRTQDIAIDGEGAPLAPTADKYLLAGYDFYLNVGGIANVSCNANGKIIAFDIGGANQILNGLAGLMNLEYDDEGKIARQGKVVNELLQQINSVDYFSQKYPKSLDNQWVGNHQMKTYFEYEDSIENRLRTGVEQLAAQTVKDILQVIDNEGFTKEKYRMLVTGGGAFNTFLMERLQRLFLEKINLEIVIPEPNIIQFKEAALMALLGVLRVENQVNCFASVTGARRDTIGGAIYQGEKRKI